MLECHFDRRAFFGRFSSNDRVSGGFRGTGRGQGRRWAAEEAIIIMVDDYGLRDVGNVSLESEDSSDLRFERVVIGCYL